MNVYPKVSAYNNSTLTTDMLKTHCDGRKPCRVMIPWDIMHDAENPQWKDFFVELLSSKSGSPDPVARNSPMDYATIIFEDGSVEIIVCRRCFPSHFLFA